ncbi:MAG: MBL fold metallo-hydrolase [Planctomycetota bacterium]|nr:MBL fold metallo-hydrolase [Planctomycetota bacterium]
MIIERSEHPRFLSNSYLVAERPGGSALIIDTGADPAPLMEAIEKHELTVDWVLLTHHHHDHVEHNEFWSERFCAPLCGHRNEIALFGYLDRLLEHEEVIEAGALRIKTLFIPGHTIGQLAFLVEEPGPGPAHLFTGDTLFRRSIGGTRGPGHATHDNIQRSIMERLMGLPHDTVVHPGHTLPTTLAEEWEHNPFVRFWRGLDEAINEPCIALDEEATLLVRAEDYDGGTKCIVRWKATAELDVVPGSSVRT